jgi:glutamate decarboxylase
VLRTLGVAAMPIVVKLARWRCLADAAAPHHADSLAGLHGCPAHPPPTSGGNPMALHGIKKSSAPDADDDVYVSTDPSFSVPKYQMPDSEWDPRHAYELVRDELMIEGNARLNLATFCQTWAEPEVLLLMAESFDKNMIDKDEYPQTAELELRCVNMLGDLWHAPDESDVIGTSTTGSSEACMLGGMALLRRWQARQKAAGKPYDRPNIIAGSNVQVCWHKFARYWQVEERLVPMSGDRYILSADEAVKLCDENTIGVIGILGSTYTGEYEPIAEINAALDELQASTGLDIPIHVDGASGGFVAPFLQPDLEWDFRVPRVKSINASGHKYGLAPLGVGWVVWRDTAELPDELIFRVNYLGGEMPTFGINFSRPGGQIVAQYYNFIRLGRTGYTKIHQTSQDVAKYLAAEIAKRGPFEIITDGADLPVLSWKLKDDQNFTLFELSSRLREYGWQVPAYTMEPDCEDLAICRIVVRHGFSHDLARLMLSHLDEVLANFAKEPARTPSGIAREGFRH